MSFLSFVTAGWFKSLLGLAIDAVKFLKGKSDNNEPISLLEVIPYFTGKIYEKVQNAINYEGYDTREKFDAWLNLVDKETGSDEGALDLITDLSAEDEEKFFDHIIEAARIYGYALIDKKNNTSTTAA